ncbi:MAG: group II intron reverse transcriptase/maturase [Deltaproteobacteria bacterium]|nr:group II intron reverse transcriptase/maturase [Deltaproteobacteria bacterium]
MLEALEKGVKGGVWFSLNDKVHRPQVLLEAWQQVRGKGRAVGSDQQSLEQFEEQLTKNLAKLEEELRTGTYRPRPIRRTYIDKPGSKDKRPLGIPTVRDKVVQTALKMVIEPIFEHEFMDTSFGFRPGIGCKDALRSVERLLRAGNTWVVDADLKSYFETIGHERLMKEVQQRIADSRVLELIESFLKQQILQDLKLWTPETGSPQGAVISPLLSNIYLHEVDKVMKTEGYEMVRYADDFVILCKSQPEAQAALTRVNELVQARGLTLHADKTSLVNTQQAGQSFDFLGYHFEKGTRWPRKKSMKKFKDTIRRKTKRSNGRSIAEIIDEVNKTSVGWFEYFKHSHWTTFKPLDGWIRRRLRSILRGYSKGKGISRGKDNIRWPNKYFQDLGYFSLYNAHRALLQSS